MIAAPAPPDMLVTLAPGVRMVRDGRVLIGGTPVRAVTLTAAGTRVLADWLMPAPVGGGAGRQTLARRLLDAGILTPKPGADAARPADLTFIVPVRDRHEQLDRCLAALAKTVAGAPIVVVDDGSRSPVRAESPGVRVVRHPRPLGPAAARNSGLRACSTPFVGFVDSDIVLPEATARGLLAHLRDPSIAVVAPRVRSLDGHGMVAAYESRHSALDMGPTPGLVAPRRRVSYVPSAVLFARRAAVASGFSESLWVGEDVDFIWRLAAQGWSIRYAPELTALHEHPARLGEFVRRRRRYAISVGVLAHRHPDALPAVWLTPQGALIWGLIVAGRRAPAALATGWALQRAARRLGSVDVPRTLAAPLTLGNVAHSGLAIGHAARRAWAPLLLAGSSRSRRLLAAAVVARLAQDAFATKRLHLGDVPLRLIDELVAALGTWEGCMRARTLRPLLPVIRAR